MVDVILVAHGKLAHEMKNSAELIFGRLPNFHSVEFLKEEGFDSIQDKINVVVNSCPKPILIIADLFCGTPYNASCGIKLQSGKEMDVLSGMSLPLILEVATMNSTDLTGIVDHLLTISRDTVQAFTKIVIEEEEEL